MYHACDERKNVQRTGKISQKPQETQVGKAYKLLQKNLWITSTCCCAGEKAVLYCICIIGGGGVFVIKTGVLLSGDLDDLIFADGEWNCSER